MLQEILVGTGLCRFLERNVCLEVTHKSFSYSLAKDKKMFKVKYSCNLMSNNHV